MARKKKAAGKDSAERWLLTYADLITLLMVFFVMLFAMSTTNVQKFQQLAASLHQAFNPGIFNQPQSNTLLPPSGDSGSGSSLLEQQTFDAIQHAVAQILKENNIDQGQVKLKITSEGIAITVSGALLFYNGTDQIKPDGFTLLTSIGNQISAMANKVRIEGHTDDIPEANSHFPTNWELSAARAVAVVRYLSDHASIAPPRLSAVGFGQYQPIVPNDTREHREANRRAVIIILYGAQPGTTPAPKP